MSEILAIHGIRTSKGYWIILDCGHWFKWTGDRRGLRIGDSFACQRDKPIVVVSAPSEKEK